MVTVDLLNGKTVMAAAKMLVMAGTENLRYFHKISLNKE